MDTFLWVNGRPEAQRGYNDDLIMSLAIACWVRDTAIINNERNMEYSKAFLDSISRSKNYLNSSIDGMKQYEVSQRMREAQQVYKDHIWLLKG